MGAPSTLAATVWVIHEIVFCLPSRGGCMRLPAVPPDIATFESRQTCEAFARMVARTTVMQWFEASELGPSDYVDGARCVSIEAPADP